MKTENYRRIKIPNNGNKMSTFFGYFSYQKLYVAGAALAPDLIFYKEGESFLDSIEIKPEYANYNEIRRGIGQCIESSIMGFRPYLTITPNFLEYAIEISKTVNFIGIICCFDTGPAFVTIPEIIPSKESLILLKEFKTGFKRINRKYLYDYKKE